MKLNREGVALNAEERNKRNQNWTTLETEVTTVSDAVKEALPIAEEALGLSGNLQAQINTLVVEGDSSVEAKQARVDAKGVEAPTLKARLDAEQQATTQQLADKVAKGQVSVSDIDKNKGLLDQTYMSPEFIQQMAGDTPVNSVPAPDSVTIQQLAITRKSTNLYNEDTAQLDFYISQNTGAAVASSGQKSTGFIPVTPETQYYLRTARRIAFYKSDKTFLSGVVDTSAKPDHVITTPVTAAFMRFSFGVGDVQDIMQVNKGSVKLAYEKWYEIVDKKYLEKTTIEAADVPPLSIENFAFAKRKPNWFYKDSVSLNTTLSRTTGATSSATNFVTSGFMEITPEKDFIIKAARTWALYDEQKAFIEGKADTTPQSNIVVTPPTNARYVRVSWYLTGDVLLVTLDTQQINEGTSLLPYSAAGFEIPRELLDIPKATDGISAGLPDTLYAVVGHELNIYFENTLNAPANGLQFDVTCSIGKHVTDRWTVTPTTAGTYPLTFSVYKDFGMVAQRTVNVVVKSAGVGAGVTKDALIMGDSTIAQDWLIRHTKTLLETDPLSINFNGTIGTYGLQHHEGRAGWTIADFRMDKLYKELPNLFYNPTIGDFDFSYYMSQRGLTSMNYVGICLGINDVFPFSSDSAVLNAIPNVKADFDFVIASIHAYDPTIKIGVYVTIPPNASQDAFGEAYNNGTTQWRYKRNNGLWIQKLVDFYKGRQSENIYLVPDNSNINTVTGFRDGVHPNEEVGDKQRGDTLYYWLKSFEV